MHPTPCPFELNQGQCLGQALRSLCHFCNAKVAETADGCTAEAASESTAEAAGGIKSLAEAARGALAEAACEPLAEAASSEVLADAAFKPPAEAAGVRRRRTSDMPAEAASDKHHLLIRARNVAQVSQTIGGRRHGISGWSDVKSRILLAPCPLPLP